MINACRTEGILEANAQPGELKFCSEYTETGNGETSQKKQHGFSQESLISFSSFNGEDFDRGQKRWNSVFVLRRGESSNAVRLKLPAM